MSSIFLTMLRSFLGTGAATRPVPRGAGIRRTRTDPHLPVTYNIRAAAAAAAAAAAVGAKERGWSEGERDHPKVSFRGSRERLLALWNRRLPA